MKKTLLSALLFLCVIIAGIAQPLKITLAPPGPLPAGTTSAPIILRIVNDSLLINYTKLSLQWDIWANGSQLQKGVLSDINAVPHHITTARLPVRVPKEDRDELLLHIRYRTSPRGKLIDQPLLIQGWTGNENFIPAAGDLTFNDDNTLFTIQSPAMQVVFDKQTGWLLHYRINGTPLAIDSIGLRPDLGLPDIIQPRLQLFSSSTGSQIVIIRTEYVLPDGSWRIHLSYTVNAAGELQVNQQAEADTTQKTIPLPHYGMTWLLPAGYDSVTWYGQMTSAGLPGVEQAVIHDRDQSTIQAVRWCAITNEKRKGLRLTADSALFTIQTSSAPASIPASGSALTNSTTISGNTPSGNAPATTITSGSASPATSAVPGTPAGKALSIIATPSPCAPDCINYRLCYKFTPLH